MAQAAGQVALQDGRCEHGSIALAYGINEVSKVVGRPLPFAHLLAVRVKRSGLIVVGNHQVAVLAHHGHPHRTRGDPVHASAPVLSLGLKVPRQATHFEEDRRDVVIQDSQHGVGRVAIVVVTESPANTAHTAGKLVHTQGPAAHIHLMDALVSQVAVARLELPVPVVVQLPARERPEGSRAAVQIPVHVLGNRLGLSELADTLARLEARSMGVANRAQAATLHEGDAVANAGAGTGLCSGLHQAAVLIRRPHHLSPFEDVVADGLLHVHVLARLAGPDGLDRVEMVGSGERHNVDVFARKRISQVGVALNVPTFPTVLGGLVPFQLRLALGEHLGIHVHERHHVHAG